MSFGHPSIGRTITVSEVGVHKPIQAQTIRVIWDEQPHSYSSVIITNNHVGFRVHTDNVRALADMLHDIADKHGL